MTAEQYVSLKKLQGLCGQLAELGVRRVGLDHDRVTELAERCGELFAGLGLEAQFVWLTFSLRSQYIVYLASTQWYIDFLAEHREILREASRLEEIERLQKLTESETLIYTDYNKLGENNNE